MLPALRCIVWRSYNGVIALYKRLRNLERHAWYEIRLIRLCREVLRTTTRQEQVLGKGLILHLDRRQIRILVRKDGKDAARRA